MSNRLKNMTQGNPFSLLLHFALPLMMGNLFQQLYTVVDTAIVGKALGVDALAALGASDWLNWMMLGMIQGLTQGFGILMAQAYGGREYARLRKVIGNAALLSAAGAVVLLLAGQLALNPVLTLLQTPQQIRPWTALYLRIMFGGIPVVMVYNLLSTVLRALGDGKTPLYAMIVASVINIVLDLVFVLVCRWGIAGAAAATVIAQAFSCVYCLLRIRGMELLQLQWQDFTPSPALCARMLYLGFPMAFQNAIISVGGMIVQRVVNGFGVIFIAAFTATNKLYGLLEVAATSFGYAMVTYTGQNLGAGKMERVRKGVRAANVLGLLTAVVIAGIMLLFGRHILSLFLSGDPAEVAMAMDIAYRYLAIMSISLPILYYLHVTRSAIQGLGNTVLPMTSGVVEFVMRTGSALLLPGLLGQEGIFWAEPLAWGGADAVLLISYLVIIHKLERDHALQKP